VKLTVSYYASLREELGCRQEQIEVPFTSMTAAQVRQWLCARGEPYASALGPNKTIRCAVNQTVCAPETLVNESSMIAFFPPVTGG
jgi:sulfur-carrier protein